MQSLAAMKPGRLLSHLFLLGICLFFFTSCASNKTIVNGLDEKEANEILVFLSGKGMTASKVQSTEGGGGGGGTKVVLWDIQVPQDEATEAMAMLNQAGLPRRRSQNLLNIFAGGGLVPSELQEKIRYQAGLAEQIASTIRKIDGVLDAEVQISFPEENPLVPGEKKGKITASVYVKHNGVLDDPNSHLITKIKRLVAASITGLDYDNVTIIPDRARFPTTSTTAAASEENQQLVNIWSIILAKDSVPRFRIIFFSFLVVLLLLLLALIWLLWKIFPLLKRAGGAQSLFNMEHLKVEPTDEEIAAKAAQTKESEKVPEAPKSESTDKDVDVT